MKLEVFNIQGEKTGRSIELPDEVFGIEPNEHAVYLAVKQYLAHQRQGTHSAKERNAVKGSRRKLKRQKGTGTARAGDIKNPLFRGGGRVFGPRPRKYSIGLPKKVKRLARKSALAAKAQQGQMVIVEDFSFDAPKTKAYVEILNKLGLGDKKVVHVTADKEESVYLSGRNLPKAQVMRAADLNTYAVLNCQTLLVSERAIEKIVEKLA